MRTSSSFRALAPDLWCVECDAWDKGLHIPLRMPVVRLPDASLLLYSPVPFDDEIAAEIAALGEVRHIVAPNLHHHFFVGEVAKRYPAAHLWGARGLAEKKPALSLGAIVAPPADALELVHIEGAPFTNELVLFHRASASLLCADLVQNVQSESSFLTRLLLRALGSWRRFGSNRVWRWQTKDRAAFRDCLARILDWEPQRIVMCHGDVVETGGAERLREAFAWVS